MTRRQFAVIGLGRFGEAMASTLVELGQDVLGIDTDDARVNDLSDRVPHLVCLNAMDTRALREAGVGDVDVAVISIGANVEASLLIVMTVKELGVPFIVAKATTPIHGRILEKLGVNRVAYPEREVATRMAHSLVVPNVLDYVGLSGDFSIVEVPAPSAFVGQTPRVLDLRAKHGLTLIAIKRSAGGPERTVVVPGPDDVIQAGDTLALIGSNTQLMKLDELLTTKGS
jgi:trk system potassium uptake protein TrkA